MPILEDGKKRLEELKNILLKKGLLDKDEEIIEAMMADLTHFAYFMGFITRRDIARLLGLTDQEAKAIIRRWKVWQEGNRSCGLSRNPFTEDWNLIRAKKMK